MLPHRFPLLLACALSVLAGCGQSPSARTADPAKSRFALQAGLEAWKNGAAPDSLQSADPPIHFVDHEWRGKRSLVQFQIDPADDANGTSRRFTVKLTLKDAKGPAASAKVVYQVTTDPAIVVTREES